MNLPVIQAQMDALLRIHQGVRLHQGGVNEKLTCMIDGEKWAVGTNGSALIACKHDLGFHEGRKTLADALCGVMTWKPTISTEVQFLLVQEAAAAGKREPIMEACKRCAGTLKVPCDECGGRGKSECGECGQPVDCEDCRCSGKVECDCGGQPVDVADYSDVYRELGEFTFNAILLHPIAQAFEEEQVTQCFVAISSNEVPALFVRSANVLAQLCAIDTSV